MTGNPRSASNPVKTLTDVKILLSRNRFPRSPGAEVCPIPILFCGASRPIAAAVTDTKMCIRWLTRDHPDFEEAREAASRTVKDATRAGEIINRIRLLFKKGTPQWELVDMNEVVLEMIALLRDEATRHSVSVQTELAPDLHQVKGDRIQLGLRISRSIVESHGGCLWAAEHPPRGASFYFTLPTIIEAHA